MKTKLLAFGISLVIFTSCKKEIAKLEGKECWKCHIFGTSAHGDYYDEWRTSCVDKNSGPPHYSDNYGNDLPVTECDKQ